MVDESKGYISDNFQKSKVFIGYQHDSTYVYNVKIKEYFIYRSRRTITNTNVKYSRESLVGAVLSVLNTKS